MDLIVILITCAAAVVLWIIFKSNHDVRGLPPVAPGAYPLIGHLPHAYIGDITTFFCNARQKFDGIYTFRMFWGKPVVMVSNKALFPLFYKAREKTLSLEEVFKPVLLSRCWWGSTDYTFFTIGIIKKLLTESTPQLIRPEAKRAIDALPPSGNLHLREFCLRMMLSILSTLLLGFDMGQDAADAIVLYTKQIHTAVIQNMCLGPYLGGKLIGPIIDRRRNAMTDKLAPLVRKAREMKNPSNFLRNIETVLKPDGTKITDRETALMINFVSFAAIGNTSALLANLIYLSTIFPGKTAELKRELAKTDPMKSRLLFSWIYEAGRMGHPLSGHIRIVKEDFEIGGYVLPKDTTLMLDIWSENILTMDHAMDFNPVRFVDEKMEDPKLFNNLAWSSGVHACPGKYLAVTQAKCVFPMILEYLQFETPNVPFSRNLKFYSAMDYFFPKELQIAYAKIPQ